MADVTHAHENLRTCCIPKITFWSIFLFCDVILGIDNHIITCLNYLKILRVNIDNAIDFSKHISDISIKCSQKVGVIMRLRKLIPMAAKLQLYKSAILSHLTYCHLVWNFCNALDRKQIILLVTSFLAELNFRHYITEDSRTLQF